MRKLPGFCSECRDVSSLRRNNDTVSTAFSLNIAIVSGSFLLILSRNSLSIMLRGL